VFVLWQIVTILGIVVGSTRHCSWKH